MTLEKEKRFLILLQALMCGTNASKTVVLDTIEANGWIASVYKGIHIKTTKNGLPTY